jgi:predicted nicotinamide N-methyase
MVPGFREEDLALHEVAAGGRRLVLRAPRDVACLPPGAGYLPGNARLPFWARLWPGGVALADVILRRLAPALRARSVIELGTGLGAAGIAAGLAGAKVTLSDANEVALAFAAANARANGVEARPLCLDWRRTARFGAPRGYAVAIAAEIFYDPRDVEPFVATVSAVLAPYGVAWLADPERLDRAPLLAAARAARFELTEVDVLPPPSGVPPADGGPPRQIRLLKLARRG